PGVLNEDPEVMAKLALAKKYGRPIDGHAPQVYGEELKRYAEHGISTDHECATVEEVKDRIACGMKVSLRHGSAAKNLDTLIDAVTDETAEHCMFCCDDVNAAEVFHDGHMQRHLRLAVARGIDPMRAVQMATINSARHYGLTDAGSIEKGKNADFAVVDNLKDFNITQTWLWGQKVAQDGQLLVDFNEGRIPKSVLSSVRIAPMTEKDFDIALPSGKARVMHVIAKELLTDEEIVELKTTDGLFDAKANPGYATIAVIERHNATGNVGLGIVSGYVKANTVMNGAVATTIAHDSHNIVAIGDSNRDMLIAVKELERMGGGMVLVKDGKVAASLKLEVAGLMSKEPAEVFIPKQVAFHKKARELFDIVEGVDPVMTLSFLALPVIPALRVTDMGLFDVRKFEPVSVAIDS
ncbi:MAG: adenine deaminase C-terminal domain-containing protein, partial [Sutterellaceae bacterium]|nr:adenine deaminase C-terminal domain-containing protein [Sutterellaceae bacterium]